MSEILGKQYISVIVSRLNTLIDLSQNADIKYLLLLNIFRSDMPSIDKIGLLFKYKKMDTFEGIGSKGMKLMLCFEIENFDATIPAPRNNVFAII